MLDVLDVLDAVTAGLARSGAEKLEAGIRMEESRWTTATQACACAANAAAGWGLRHGACSEGTEAAIYLKSGSSLPRKE